MAKWHDQLPDDSPLALEFAALEAQVAAAGALVTALEKAHAELDDVNAHGILSRDLGCVFCGGRGYDADGLVHDADCVIVEARAALAKAQEAGITGTADEGGR